MNSSSQDCNGREMRPVNVWNKKFASIFFANMAMNLGQHMSNPLLAVYADSLGASASTIGILMSLFAVSAISFRFISAPVIDTYNRKYIVIVAMLTLGTAYFGFGMSHSVYMLMCFRLLQGIGMAFGNSCCLAMVSDLLPKNKYGIGIGYFSVATVVSQAMGPFLGLALSGLIGYSGTYVVNAGIMLFAIFLAFMIKYEFRQTRKLRFSFHNAFAREALIPVTVLFFMVFGNTVINAFLIVYARKQGITANVGLYFLVSAAIMVFTRPLIGRMTDRFGFTKVFIPAALFTVYAFIVISFSHSLSTLLFAAVLAAFGYGACQPALSTMTMKSVSRERRGAGSSTNYIGMDLGNLVGPTAAGSVAQVCGYTAMWYFMSVPIIVATLLVFLLRNKFHKIEKDFLYKNNE